MTKPLEPLVVPESSGPLDILDNHLRNMQSCGVCYSRYRALIEALEARE